MELRQISQTAALQEQVSLIVERLVLDALSDLIGKARVDDRLLRLFGVLPPDPSAPDLEVAPKRVCERRAQCATQCFSNAILKATKGKGLAYQRTDQAYLGY